MVPLIQRYIQELRPQSSTKAIFIDHRTGKRLSPHFVTMLAKRARDTSGIRTRASSHSFRKSSATHMLKNGAPLHSVQALLGHELISSSQVYTKVYPRDLIKMHRSSHPREKQKALKMPELTVPKLLTSRKRFFPQTLAP